MLGIVFLNEVFTTQSILGIILTLAGSFWYSRVKVAENKAELKTTHNSGNGEKTGNAANGFELSNIEDEDDDVDRPDEVPLQLAPLKDPNPKTSI
eukprot:Selendium_serpulae@DN5270_c0_g1_i3.p1